MGGDIPLQIGGDSIYGQYFQGMIDEVRVYNVALTQAQIQADFQRSLVGNEPGLVLYIPFSEGAGTTITDKTANAVDGTLNGCTWVEGPLFTTGAQDDWTLLP